MRPERCRSLPVVPVALGDRLRPAPLLAFIVVIEDRAFGADDPAATVAIGFEAVLANQRTDPRRLELDRLRSEEHTSELQSHLNLVCRLLLEKKKKQQCNSH